MRISNKIQLKKNLTGIEYNNAHLMNCSVITLLNTVTGDCSQLITESD